MKRVVFAIVLTAAFGELVCAHSGDERQVKSESGAVKGTAVFRGDVPVSPVPDNAGVRRPLIEVDSKSRGISGVVVALRPDANVKSATSGEKKDGAPVVVDQLGDEFVPHVTAAREGETVLFSNSDPANHNVRSSAGPRENQFNIFIGNGGSYERKFKADPKNRPVQLGCDIHPWMRAWIYVFDHPFFVVTDERGQFEISQVPAGKYRLIVQQPDLRYRDERDLEITAGKTEKIEVLIEGKETGQ